MPILFPLPCRAAKVSNRLPRLKPTDHNQNPTAKTLKTWNLNAI